MYSPNKSQLSRPVINLDSAAPNSRFAGGGDGRVSVYLNRLTGFDHQCRVRYNIVLGENDSRLESGIVDDISNTDGKGYGWHPRTRFNDLVYKVGD
jgi:hypothetical protein